MPGYGERKSRAIGLDDQAFGGAGMNLSLDAVMGEGDMITTFDDFNSFVEAEGFGDSANWPEVGWLTTDGSTTPAFDVISMNDRGNVTNEFDSCIKIVPGTTDDGGGSMQLDPGGGGTTVDNGGHVFPHIWIPEATSGGVEPTSGGLTAEVLDNTTWVFACRIGLRADHTPTTNTTNWDSKMFIGWAEANDTSVLTAADGLITIASGGPLIGFHILEDGSIRGISHRTGATAMAEGTNFTELIAAGGVDSTLVNGARVAGDTMWFDLALRMEISDNSATANGATHFYYRGPTNAGTTGGGGRSQFDVPGEGYKPWRAHPTVLFDQTPNNNVALVPHIEVLNGPTLGADGIAFVDWWAMGRNRIGT